MKKKIIFALICIIGMVSVVKAQVYSVKGRLLSDENIVDYAYTILQKQNFTFVSGGISEKNARFRIGGITDGDYRLIISCIGSHDKKINIKMSGRILDLGDIEIYFMIGIFAAFLIIYINE
jgi:deoxyribose-phosphate aldolase